MEAFEIIKPGLLFQSPLPDEDLILSLDPALIVSLTGQELPLFAIFNCRVQWRIADDDLPDLKTLNSLVGFISSMIEARKRVLVHCLAGLNRSGLVCALVFRDCMGVSGLHAAQWIQSQVPEALFNETFYDYVASLPTPDLDERS